jgi:hypothetical protein
VPGEFIVGRAMNLFTNKLNTPATIAGRVNMATPRSGRGV